jgi:hypothetical protein
MTRSSFLAVLAASLVAPCSLAEAQQAPPLELRVPNRPDSVKFAIMGDFGDASDRQYQTAQMMARYHGAFRFSFAITVGDNLYGRERPRDYEEKFERPYKPLLDGSVKIYASLGNHDNPEQRFYKLFNMNGERYYTFKPKDGVRFFALDTTYMNPAQLEWLEKELKDSGSDWKIAFFHHPLYSSGKRHGPREDLRVVLEPLFVKYGVTVVFAGHEHFYERIKPQKGIQHFIQGSTGKLRKNGIRKGSEFTEIGYDQDNTFMIAEIDGDQMYFQTISRTGATVDSGSLTVVKLQSQAAR